MNNTKLLFVAAVLVFSLIAAPILMAQGVMADPGTSTSKSESDVSATPDSTGGFAPLDAAAAGETAEASSAETQTVAEAKTLEDATEVTLKGNIQSPVGEGKYLFADETGSINIVIPEEILASAGVAEDVPVVIYGEVDIIDNGMAEINVSQIEKLM